MNIWHLYILIMGNFGIKLFKLSKLTNELWSLLSYDNYSYYYLTRIAEMQHVFTPHTIRFDFSFKV